MVDGPNGNGAPVEPSELRAAEQALRVAEAAYLDRMAWARRVGLTFNDKRDTWGVLGYPETITVENYRMRYTRGGIAGRVVDAMPKAVWRGDGKLVEDKKNLDKNTKFEDEWYALNDQHKVWSTLMRAHILASLGSFSALLIGALGDLGTPLPMGKPGGVLYLTPFGGGVVDTSMRRGAGQGTGAGADVTVATWDEDIRSPRFGLPQTYQLKRTNISAPELQRPVHWSRVIHIPAPGFLDDAVFGPPALEGVYNYLLDLDKCAGGGSEAFWLRANAGIHLDIDKKMALPAQDDTLAKLKEQAEAYEHQLTRMLRTRGVNVQQLGSDVADFKNPVDVLVMLIAGTTGMPKRILTGSERGELASTQDADNWLDQVNDCRTGYAHPVILRPFVERLIEFGYLTRPAQWEPQWHDQPTDENEKLDAAVKMVSLNDHGETVVTGAEVREFLGKEPLDAEQLDDAEDEDAQVARLEAALRKGGTLSIAVRP